eukprot:gnl/Spiro4/2668_TR1291_c0_g1_i1.p1 gnl/Spiro4/2668_TR1291_c0_g1~~gnl/Spiro4/2668_TR1291_c0_g1_i1.p1  ORF type:complete len:330 (-),score=51.73 gnl/Spiro4/2668_TR1291_c0_g1_i1:209-1198(-)
MFLSPFRWAAQRGSSLPLLIQKALSLRSAMDLFRASNNSCGGAEYLAIISRHIREEKLAVADALLQEMEAKKLTLDPATYAALVAAFGSNCSRLARGVLMRMLVPGVSPATFGLLVSSYSKSLDLDGVVHILSTVMPLHRVVPPAQLFLDSANSFSRAGRVSEARVLMRNLARMGLQASPSTLAHTFREVAFATAMHLYPTRAPSAMNVVLEDMAAQSCLSFPYDLLLELREHDRSFDIARIIRRLVQSPELPGIPVSSPPSGYTLCTAGVRDTYSVCVLAAAVARAGIHHVVLCGDILSHRALISTYCTSHLTQHYEENSQCEGVVVQ